MSHTRTDEAAFVELSRAQPEAKAIMNQHLDAVAAFVDEEVGVMSARLTEHIHNARQRLVDAGAHVERLYGQPGRIDADHLISSRNSSAHSCAAEAGHSTVTRPPRRRTSIRIAAETGLEDSGSGTNLPSFSIATLGDVLRIAIGLPLRSACLTHRCN